MSNEEIKTVNCLTLAEFKEEAEKLTDEGLELMLGIYLGATHTGRWGSERAESLKIERSRRFRARRGEGRIS